MQTPMLCPCRRLEAPTAQRLPAPWPYPPRPAMLGALCEEHGICNLSVQHVRGDPRRRADMRKLVDVSEFDAVLVLRGGWLSLPALLHLRAFLACVYSLLLSMDHARTGPAVAHWAGVAPCDACRAHEVWLCMIHAGLGTAPACTGLKAHTGGPVAQ